MGSDKRNSRRRRWRSMEEAYQEGQAVGFMAACELVQILEDPEAFIKRVTELGEGFSKAMRAALERPAGEIREVDR